MGREGGGMSGAKAEEIQGNDRRIGTGAGESHCSDELCSDPPFVGRPLANLPQEGSAACAFMPSLALAGPAVAP